MPSTGFEYCPMCRGRLARAERGGKPRLVCIAEHCGYVHWDSPVPVVAAIVQSGNDVILVRSRGWPDTWFGLVAGFVESGESTEQAVLREIDEELGVVADSCSYLASYPFDLRNQILIVFHVNTRTATVRLDNDELDAYLRVPVERLIPWSRGTGLAVRDWLASLGYERDPVDFGNHIDPRLAPKGSDANRPRP